jgi:GNAT superfamily N-acetyltransferase
MVLEFTVDPDLTDKLRAEIVACWTDVSNAGGAVGFVPPVAMDDVLPVAAKAFAGVDSGQDRLIIGRDMGANAGVSCIGATGIVAAAGEAAGVEAGGVEAAGVRTGGVGAAGVGAGGAQEVGGGRLAALALISDSQFRLTEHWRTVKRVMVHPDFQGLGYGALLMAEVERAARAMGLELLTLDCRDGTGNNEFYKKCGYVEYGRLPGALRLGPEDYRDQILMTLTLRG